MGGSRGSGQDVESSRRMLSFEMVSKASRYRVAALNRTFLEIFRRHVQGGEFGF